MRIGILADIHEAVDELSVALAEFQRRRVDMIVSLGDACNTFGPASRADAVTAMLRASSAVGVWGNHDVGLCFEVSDQVRRKASPEILNYMAGMQAYLIVENCRFSHIEPWLDARRIEDLWYFDGPPDTPVKAARSFTAVPERLLFVGHFHQWLIMTPSARVEWNGEAPLTVEHASRHLIVVAAVVDGWCAVFDTELSTLIPIRCTA
jgi:hypothetical protein